MAYRNEAPNGEAESHPPRVARIGGIRQSDTDEEITSAVSVETWILLAWRIAADLVLLPSRLLIDLMMR